MGGGTSRASEGAQPPLTHPAPGADPARAPQSPFRPRRAAASASRRKRPHARERIQPGEDIAGFAQLAGVMHAAGDGGQVFHPHGIARRSSSARPQQASLLRMGMRPAGRARPCWRAPSESASLLRVAQVPGAGAQRPGGGGRAVSPRPQDAPAARRERPAPAAPGCGHASSQRHGTSCQSRISPASSSGRKARAPPRRWRGTGTPAPPPAAIAQRQLFPPGAAAGRQRAEGAGARHGEGAIAQLIRLYQAVLRRFRGVTTCGAGSAGPLRAAATTSKLRAPSSAGMGASQGEASSVCRASARP